MSIIERMRIPVSSFISTILDTFAKTHELADNAQGMMQISGVVRELFSDLKRHPPKRRPVMPAQLAELLASPVPQNLVKKYQISPDMLVRSWTYANLSDSSILDGGNVGASPDCEHHSRWKQRQEQSAKEATERAADEVEAHDAYPEQSVETDKSNFDPKELESLLEL
jgi:hypothetical protein